jgi:hypothetical protein
MKVYKLLFGILLISASTFGQRKNWAVPDFGVMQYAGSIGTFSVGAGYDVFNSKARFSMHYGTVPKALGGPINIFALKLFCKPASFTVWNRVKMNPFDVGITTSFNYGDNFEERWPEGVHPRGYYWWNPSLRLHIGMESSVTYRFPKDHRLRSITGYYEFNTNELYFVSFIKNTSTVSFWDIVKIGTGVRINF